MGSFSHQHGCSHGYWEPDLKRRGIEEDLVYSSNSNGAMLEGQGEVN